MAVAERSWARRVGAVLIGLALLAPLLTVGAVAVGDYSEHRSAVAVQRRGVEYLRPLSALVGALVAGQSAAVRGEPVEAASIRSALDETERAEQRHGSVLQTGTRWTSLRDRTRELVGAPGGAGSDAFQRWSPVVDLARTLATRIGDTSGLILDQDLDARYLVDAALLHLPSAVVGAGQIADVDALAGDPPSSANQVRIAIVRAQVAAAAAEVDTGIGKAIDTTGSRRTPTALLAPLDQFGAAIDALAPPVDMLALPPLPSNVPAAAVGVRVAASRLAEVIWIELDALLDERQNRLTEGRLWILGAVAFGVLVTLGAVIVLWRGRPPRAEPPPPTVTSHVSLVGAGSR